MMIKSDQVGTCVGSRSCRFQCHLSVEVIAVVVAADALSVVVVVVVVVEVSVVTDVVVVDMAQSVDVVALSNGVLVNLRCCCC